MSRSTRITIFQIISMKYLLIVLGLLLTIPSLAQPAGYAFGKEISVDATEVTGSSPLSNFPVLISITDTDLRSTSNGGNVENSNGFDITFTQLDCNTPLLFDLESYNPTTGELVIWVQIPSLSNSVDTRFFMYYGNNSIATNQSTTAIWSTLNYDGVWHLNNNVNDRSGSANNGTNNGSTNRSPAFIGDGRNFVDPNHWIELPNHSNRSGNFSYSAWIRTVTNNQAGQRVICDDATNDGGGHAISVGDPGTGAVRFYVRGLTPVSLDSPTNLIQNNTWHFVAATYNNTTKVKRLYIDGVLIGSATVTGTLTGAAGNASIGGEIASGESGNRFNGDIDEVRSSNSTLSSDWLATEYNNQSNPSSFISVSAEYSASGLCNALPIKLLNFTAEVNSFNQVDINWTTVSEVNNNFFTIERSVNQSDWETVAIIAGAGNSSEIRSYNVIDKNPIEGWSYYRLKQTDFDGKYEYAPIKTVNINSTNASPSSVFPNPTYNAITMIGKNLNVKDIELYTILGHNITAKVDVIKQSDSKILIDLSQLHEGVYIIKSMENSYRIMKL